MKQLSNLQEFSVTDLSVSLKNTIEDKFSYIKLTGEISGFKRHSSGHCYFALKDEKSVIDAVMWKGNASKLNFPLKDGLEVCGTGKVTTYAGRSKYQIILDDLKPAGIGALMALLEELKKKLTDEGLFREDIKKPLPFLPRRIGIITSPTGAVIRDILHRLNDRFFPYTYVFPVAVQGDLSARQVSYAIKFFNKCTEETPIKRPDVIIVARGGGSVEDLWSFNEEIVARSVAASQIPIISAVGHETDFTLCDFAADKRAPTPTAAAEMATPIKADLVAYLEASKDRIYSALSNLLQRRRDQHHLTVQKLPNMIEAIQNQKQSISTYNDKLSHNLKQNIWTQKSEYHNHRSLLRRSLIQNLVQTHQQKSDTLSARLEQSVKMSMQKHLQAITLKRQNLSNLSEKLSERMSQNITKQKEKLEFHHTLLKNMSYKSVLGRGYAVIHSENGIITNKKTTEHHIPTEIEFTDGIYKI